MKKNIILIAAGAILGASALLSGCSCVPQEPLSFGVSPAEETLTYTVEYSADYIEAFKKDDSIAFVPEFSDGRYVCKCQKVVSRENIDSDIKDLLTDKDIYELTTDFSIDLTFTVGGTEYSRTDTVSTKAYIAPSGMSLAPLYAKESAEYVIFAANENTVQASIIKTESETFYNQSNYTKIKKHQTFNLGEEITFGDATSEEYTGNYSFRAAIDNAELYFSLRGLTAIDEKSSKTVAVISSTYNVPTNITVQSNGKSTKELTVKYNGNDITANIAYVNLAFQLSNTNTAGKPQYVSVQTDKAGELDNFNIPLVITKPLVYYGSFRNMGALVFTISEIER